MTFNYSFISNAKPKQIYHPNRQDNYFNKDMNFYICSSGGCGSTVIYNYLSNFGKVHHIHDRYPPNKLTYIGSENTDEGVYREWFNSAEIPEDKLNNYKVIFIYRNPLQVIYSRFAQRHGPNINHLKNIKCDNSGNIHIFDVLKSGKDLYKMEDFFDNYVTSNHERNYNLYCIKYEMFFNNISLFNKILGIPDVTYFYPEKRENPKQLQFQKQLNIIYGSLIKKMNSMRFIEIIPRKQELIEEKQELIEEKQELIEELET
jgi:hypothetical protein